ncbi:hypothetical protein QVD99_001072 [Batrachochytrium dendrobatidis]|nr:hypothetical protein QVD99_001072 [Batrachochytrium dendrobatidis]
MKLVQWSIVLGFSSMALAAVPSDSPEDNPNLQRRALELELPEQDVHMFARSPIPPVSKIQQRQDAIANYKQAYKELNNHRLNLRQQKENGLKKHLDILNQKRQKIELAKQRRQRVQGIKERLIKERKGELKPKNEKKVIKALPIKEKKVVNVLPIKEKKNGFMKFIAKMTGKK